MKHLSASDILIAIGLLVLGWFLFTFVLKLGLYLILGILAVAAIYRFTRGGNR